MDAQHQRAFEREMVSYDSRLRGFARSLTKNEAQAEDLVQDAYMKAIMYRDSFELGTNMFAWLCKITRNLFLSQKRKDWREVADVDDRIAHTVGVDADQHQLLEERDEQERARQLLLAVRQLLKKLPELQREAFWLIHTEGHSYQDVADMQSCPIGTIKSRVSRALRRLLGLVAERGGAGEQFTADQWSAAFENLSPVGKRRPQEKGVKATVPDYMFCDLPFDLIETVRLGRGPTTQVFRIAA